ncbi:hypothetical protein [Zoogloea sp.]|jgi:hypothetical protein|uniref:hypothetical protein n=1 Tax=Zoogloea sp. TaxID=49181 RepID=UPI0037D9BD18
MTIVETNILTAGLPPKSDPGLQKVFRVVIGLVRNDDDAGAEEGLYAILKTAYEAGAENAGKVATELAKELGEIVGARVMGTEQDALKAVDSFIARRAKIIPKTPTTPAAH